MVSSDVRAGAAAGTMPRGTPPGSRDFTGECSVDLTSPARIKRRWYATGAGMQISAMSAHTGSRNTEVVYLLGERARSGVMAAG